MVVGLKVENFSGLRPLRERGEKRGIVKKESEMCYLGLPFLRDVVEAEEKATMMTELHGFDLISTGYCVLFFCSLSF